MATIIELHLEAMELAEEAVCQGSQGNFDMALSLFRRASQLETEAAEASQIEVSRSILSKSALALAKTTSELELMLQKNSGQTAP